MKSDRTSPAAAHVALNIDTPQSPAGSGAGGSTQLTDASGLPRSTRKGKDSDKRLGMPERKRTLVDDKLETTFGARASEQDIVRIATQTGESPSKVQTYIDATVQMMSKRRMARAEASNPSSSSSASTSGASEASSSNASKPGPWMPSDEQMKSIGDSLGMSTRQVKRALDYTYLWQGKSLFLNSKLGTKNDHVRMAARELMQQAQASGNPDHVSITISPSASSPTGSSQASSSIETGSTTSQAPSAGSAISSSMLPTLESLIMTPGQILQAIGLRQAPPVPVAYTKAIEAAAANVLNAALNLGGAAPTGVPATDLAQVAHTYGATLPHLQGIAATAGGVFAPSASAGESLNSLNDHVGVLILPIPDGSGSTVATRLAVVKAAVPAVGVAGAPGHVPAAEKYFVKGYDNKLLDIEQLQSAIQVHTAPPAPGAVPGPNETALNAAEAPVPPWGGAGRQLMETPFLSAVRILSDNSQLWARRSEAESDSVHTSEPPHKPAQAKKEGWANSEAFMAPGAGPIHPNGSRKFQIDFNPVEDRLMIFRNEKSAHLKADGTPVRNNALLSQTTAPNVKKAPLFLEGPVLAEIKGIKHWELMGPADQHAGVKGGNVKRAISTVGRQLPNVVRRQASELSNYFGSARPGARIVITTEDDVKHQLELTEAGIKMKMLNPKFLGASGPIVGRDTPVASDVDVYSYRGVDTGRGGTTTGLPQSEVAMSTGETFPMAPMIKNRSGVTGSVKAGAETLARLALRQPLAGSVNHGKLSHLINTAAAATVQFMTVFAMSELNSAMKGSHGTDGKYFEGAGSFSAVGAANVTSLQLAGAAASIVVAQECITKLLQWASHLAPAAMKHPPSMAGKSAQFLLRAGKEMLRQETNYGIQHAMGLRPGTGAAEHGMMALSSLMLTGIDKLHERLGSSTNHPHAKAAFTVARQGAYNVMRAGQVTLNKPGDAPTSTDFKEALVNRLMTRTLDQILVPFVNTYLNETGLMGPNARALTHQSNRESKSLVPRMATGLNDAVMTVDAFVDETVLRAFQGKDFFRTFNLTEEQSKQLLNRVVLAQEKAVQFMSGLLGKPNAVPGAPNHDPDVANNVVNAGAVGLAGGVAGTLTPAQTASINNMYAVFDDRVAKAGGPGTPLLAPPAPTHPLATGPMTSDLKELHPKQHDFARSSQRRFVGSAPNAAGVSGEDGPYPVGPGPHLMTPPQVTQPIAMGYDLKQYETRRTREQRTGMGVLARPPAEKVLPEQTTFSFLPQVKAWHRTAMMEEQPGIHSLDNMAPVSLDGRNVPMNAEVKHRIDLSYRDYTVESQYFHYGSRWDVTGLPKIQQVSPGIDIAYNHLSKPGNVKGTSAKFVDPIETIYLNLGAVHSPKFPSEVYRAAVTEAEYRPRNAGEGPDARFVMSQGELGTLTEILSASTQPSSVAAFGQGINGQGAAPRENSQRLVIAQETAINVAKKTDLVQAEVVLTQGAVLEMVHIDATAGRGAGPLPPGAQDIGQVVYAKQVDTYALEQAFTNLVAGGPAPAVGTKMIDPDSGHWHEYQPADPGADANGLIRSHDTKNYFLGKKLESDTPAGVPTNAVARWFQPFTSDEAPRTMKDGIHAAILREDPIVPMLNDAVLNSHHTYFRRKGGFFNGPPGPQRAAELARSAANRARLTGPAGAVGAPAGGGITTQLRAMPMNGSLVGNPAMEQMVAGMMSHMLRERVHMVPIAAANAVVPGGNALPPATVKFDKTFDRVDLENSPLDGKNPKPPITIGVAPDGYYLMRHDGGSWRADTKVSIDDAGGNGKTVGNLMNAVLHAGKVLKPQRSVKFHEEPNPAAGVVGQPAKLLTRTMSGIFAEDRAAQLKAKMESYFSTPYEVLERGVSETADAINARLALAAGAPGAL